MNKVGCMVLGFLSFVCLSNTLVYAIDIEPLLENETSLVVTSSSDGSLPTVDDYIKASADVFYENFKIAEQVIRQEGELPGLTSPASNSFSYLKNSFRKMNSALVFVNRLAVVDLKNKDALIRSWMENRNANIVSVGTLGLIGGLVVTWTNWGLMPAVTEYIFGLMTLIPLHKWDAKRAYKPQKIDRAFKKISEKNFNRIWKVFFDQVAARDSRFALLSYVGKTNTVSDRLEQFGRVLSEHLRIDELIQLELLPRSFCDLLLTPPSAKKLLGTAPRR